MTRRWFVTGRLESVLAATLLVLLSVVFWKVRIFDLGIDPRVTIGNIDLFITHYPGTWYAFNALRHGDVPLWNPYQFCGEPFLALPWIGLFYPLNSVYLIFDVATGTEVSFILHMLLGAISMWCLLRHFGVGALGALCSAVTFIWSGWLILNAGLPLIFAEMTWIPLTVLLVDRVLQGAKLAWAVWVLGVACQVLLGATEVFIHALYMGALFTLARLAGFCWGGQWGLALKRGGLALFGIAAGMLLCAFQLLPSLELVQRSTRAPGILPYEQVSYGAIPAMMFLRGALDVVIGNAVTVGVLPLVGIPLVLGFRKYRLLWICGLVAAVGGALLVFGGPVFRLYYALGMGSWFRRPMKFLDIYAFGQALLVGVAVARLDSWVGLSGRRLWVHPAWLAALGLGAAGLLWRTISGAFNPYLAGMLVLMLLFGSTAWGALRRSVIVAACVLQGASLFFGVGNTLIRPSRQPDIFWQYDDLKDFLRDRIGNARVYLSQTLLFSPALTSRQGLLNHINVVNDYESLAQARYGDFFDYLSARPQDRPFDGIYQLGPQTRWRLMDLTGTRYFVVLRGDPADGVMAASTHTPRVAKFRLIRDGLVRIYERPDALPRVYFAPHARVVEDPRQLLATLDSASFDPHSEVLLEETPAAPIGAAPAPPEQPNPPRISRYSPEQVTVLVEANMPGFLVLTDLYYPGWKAFADGHEVPMYRANYLFRAVWLPAGNHEIRFEYQPPSLRIGAILTAGTAIALAVIFGWSRRAARVASGGAA